MSDIQQRVRDAVQHFWITRQKQAERQGSITGVREPGARSAVTGGAQMDGFVRLVRELLCTSGVQDADLYCKRKVEIPGWFRPEKCWDLLVVNDGLLVAAIEFK